MYCVLLFIIHIHLQYFFNERSMEEIRVDVSGQCSNEIELIFYDLQRKERQKMDWFYGNDNNNNAYIEVIYG